MKEQNTIHDTVMKDLILAYEKLRKTNEELEAKVEERTGELKSLNDELKKEMEIRKKIEEILIKREFLLSIIFHRDPHDTSILIWTSSSTIGIHS